jgi:hypothetical protein
MWLSDLGEFEIVWKRCIEIRTAEGVTSASSAAAHSKKGKAVKKVIKRNVVVNE